MVDGFVRSLGSGVFVVALVSPVGDFFRSRIFAVTASKDRRPAHTPYESLDGGGWSIAVDRRSIPRSDLLAIA
jgi:hypothetical protein